jgi:DNA/RNA-binding domain of Phe-tRNA-synthetase-like protein
VILLPLDVDLASIVRPLSARVAPVVVVERAAWLDQPMAQAETRMRAVGDGDDAGTTAAVRTMYKRIGVDPTKTRPSSEALLRRVRRGDPLPRVNTAVDVINWTSLETRLPFGLYDADRLSGEVVVRRGVTGESYAGIRKDEVHVDGRLVLADDIGAFGNPTSDSLRTCVTTATRALLVVVFAPAQVAPREAEAALQRAVQRLGMGGDA